MDEYDFSIIDEIAIAQFNFIKTNNKTPNTIYLGSKQIKMLFKLKHYSCGKKISRMKVCDMFVYEVDSDDHIKCVG